MTWLITDRAGDLHEVLEDERILVLCENQAEAHHWLRDQGIPPYGRHVSIVSGHNPRILDGGRWDVYVFLPGYLGAPSDVRDRISQVLLRNDTKRQAAPKRIHA